MKLVLASEALDDLECLLVVLAEHNPKASVRAARVIVESAETVLQFPRRGAPCRVQNARDLPVPFGSGAYLLRYAVLEERDEIIILRLWHSRESHL